MLSRIIAAFILVEKYVNQQQGLNKTLMDNLQISDKERQLMHKYLIPGFYLQKVARKENDIKMLEKAAEECAQIF